MMVAALRSTAARICIAISGMVLLSEVGLLRRRYHHSDCQITAWTCLTHAAVDVLLAHYGTSCLCRYADGVLTSSAYRTADNALAQSAFNTNVAIERIAILGLPGGVSGWQASVQSYTCSACCLQPCPGK
jgi:ethanolamine ammonia-lyase small subunit